MNPFPPADTPSEPDGPDPGRWWALAVLAAAQLMIVLDASIVNIALPSAQEDLGISNADRQWMVTAYTLAFGGLLLLGGRIADYTGRKRTFIIGLLGFAGASALGGLAPNQELLFAARALQGAFAALLAPAALSLVTVTFTEPKERAKAFGVFGALAGGGAAIGLIVGGVLTEYASWRWCLGVNVPFALIVAAAARSRSCTRARRTATPGTTSPACCSPRSACSRWSTASPRPPGRSTPTTRARHRGAGLGRLRRTLTFLVARGRAARRVRALGAPGHEPAAAAARRARPQPRRVLPGVPARRRRAVRDVPVPDLLLPGQPRLQPAQGRLRVPAVQPRHHPRPPASWPSCCPGSARGR